MRSTKLLTPEQVVEEIGVIPLCNVEERYDVSRVTFKTMRRFNEEVNFSPCLTPVSFRDTVICFKDSTRKRFKSQTHYEPRVKPRKFSDTLIVFPKRPVRSYVTCVDYHIDECRRWFKTTMEFKALTYTTNKIISKDVNANNDSSITEVDVSKEDGSYDTCAHKQQQLPSGPGASQIYLPRWEKAYEDVETGLTNGERRYNGYLNNVDSDDEYQGGRLVNGDLLDNGFL